MKTISIAILAILMTGCATAKYDLKAPCKYTQCNRTPINTWSKG